MLSNPTEKCGVTRKNFVCIMRLTKMKQIELMSKLVLALIAIVVFSAITVPVVAAPNIPSNFITSEMIKDGEVKTQDLATGAIQLNVHTVKGDGVIIGPHDGGQDIAECPAGEIVTGGGFFSQSIVRTFVSVPGDENEWAVSGINDDDNNPQTLTAFALCVDPTIP